MNTITRTLRLIALCVMVVVFALPSTALAVEVPRSAPATTTGQPTTQAEAERFIPLAEAAWPNSPCNGKIKIELTTQTVLQASARPQAGEPTGDRQYGGVAPVNDQEGVNQFGVRCTMLILNTSHGEELCTTIVHEAGHLSGLWHSLEPLNVMFWKAELYTPCLATTWYPRADIAIIAMELLAKNHNVMCTRLRKKPGKNPRFLCQKTDPDSGRKVPGSTSYVITPLDNYLTPAGKPRFKAVIVKGRVLSRIKLRL